MTDAETALAWVDACRPLLPIQNPLWAFVHNNILQAWEDEPFPSAVRRAAALYRARPFETEDFYREQLAAGRIARSTLGEVLLADWPRDRTPPADGAEAVERFLADPAVGDDEPSVELVPGPAAEHLVRYSVRDRPLQDWLVPWIASYLDQGLSPWPNPFADEGLWAYFRAAVEHEPAFAFPWAAALKARLRAHVAAGRTAAEVICVEVRAFASEGDAEAYCLQTLFVLKGWSGMVNKLETEPHLAPREAPRLALHEWAAAMLVSIHALDDWLRREHPPRSVSVRSHYTQGLGRLRRWQAAYERAFAGALFATLERDLADPRTAPVARAQALVCMDDRVESLRRALERGPHHVATYGTVGFFGLDMNFHALGAGRPSRQCPPVIEPSRTIREVPLDDAGREFERSRAVGRFSSSLAMLLYFQSRTLTRGLAVALAAGFLSFVPLVFKLLLPGRVHHWRSWIKNQVLPRPRARIDVDGPGGYSPAEQSAVVASILRSSGLVRDFAPIVAVVAHGSTTANNPLRQAYGCGACSGNSGAPNARAFALLANRAEVRASLAGLGIHVPPSTVFVPFHHDTTTDSVDLLDEHLVPPFCSTEARALWRALAAAAKEVAAERCLRLLPDRAPLAPEAAFQHVQDRGHDLAQPRPEYGHNRTAACIVGRRDCTIGSHLDRRSFLVSYDPTTDADGSVLREAVLGTVPVAVNIAMDYYFSRVDNDGFGCGSKLPLNVTSLLGVITGSKSDLRIGLARQQVELHEPMRCLVVVEAAEEHVLSLFLEHPRLSRLVRGGWMRLARIDPRTRAIQVFDEVRFVPWREAMPEFDVLPKGAVASAFDRSHDRVMEGHW